MIAIIVALIFVQHIHGESSSYPVGDVRNCPTEPTVNPGSPLVIMHAMPGLGFDGLRNIELGQVYSKNYSSCQVSDDGYYLLPDDINLIPIHESEFDTFTEVFQHHYQYTSSSSASINVETSVSFGFGHASGRFSAEYLNTKKKMVSTKSSSVRIGLKHHLYSAHVNLDSQLHPSFKSRLLDLAANIQNNDTQMAHYLSDLIVRDYGTHVVTSVETGGALYQTSLVSQDFISEDNHMQLSADFAASVRVRFIAAFSLNTNFEYDDGSGNHRSTSDTITNVCTSTHGGPPFRMDNFSYTDWQNELPNNLVAIDRHGQLLPFAMTTANLPELPDMLLTKTSDYIYQSIERYYKTNTVKGCTDMNSNNFNFHANLDDNSCKKERQNYTFGGTYQTCQDHDDAEVCDYYGADQVNPLTSDYSCPGGYEKILLHNGTLSKMVQVTYTYTEQECKEYVIFFTSCKVQTVSSQRSEMRYSTYNAYWCYAPPGKQESADSGYMFGGLYTSKTPNPVTRTSSCPPFYNTLHFGEDIKVCVSNDAQAEDNAIPFGGFYSCKSGNPLAITPDMYNKLESNNQLQHGSSFPMECSHHYNQFLIAIDEGCVVNYCSQFKDLVMYAPKPPIVPPYRMKPPMTVNKTESLVIFGPYGKIWVKDDNGGWFEFKNDSVIGSDYLQSLYSQQQNIAEDITTPTEPPTNVTPSVVLSRPFKGREQTASSADSASSPSYQYTGAEVAGFVIGSVVSTALCIAFIAAVGCGVKKLKKKHMARKEAVLYLDKSETGEND